VSTALERTAPPLAESAPPPRRRRRNNRFVEIVAPVLTFVALLFAWEGARALFGWQAWLVPGPIQVLHALEQYRSLLPLNTWTTVQETLIGYGASIGIAIPIAVAIVYSRLLELTVYPLLIALQSVPKVAIAPILLLWMGFGIGPKVVMTILICFFPIVLSTVTGLRSTPPELDELMRSLSPSRLQMFVKVSFPAALPHVFVGLKVAITLSVIGAVIGEFVGADHGLGWLIKTSESNVNTALGFGAIAILSAISIVLYYTVVAVERLAIPWARYEQQ
jgi:NitT/TauT family transport system permease protein